MPLDLRIEELSEHAGYVLWEPIVERLPNLTHYLHVLLLHRPSSIPQLLKWTATWGLGN